MASDFRSLQHDAAMATFSLISDIARLRELHRRHPAIIAAEYRDITTAFNELAELIHAIRKQAA